MTGSGALTLSGTGTFTGGATVTDGTLIVTNPEGLLTGSNVSVGDQASLSLFGGVVPAGSSAWQAVVGASGGASAVPEPGALALLIAGVVGAAGYFRFVRRR